MGDFPLPLRALLLLCVVGGCCEGLGIPRTTKYTGYIVISQDDLACEVTSGYKVTIK